MPSIRAAFVLCYSLAFLLPAQIASAGVSACCLGDGDCVDTTGPDCEKGLGGTFLLGVTCAEIDQCVSGACCQNDGKGDFCTTAYSYECFELLGGTFFEGFTCSELGNCNAGACCYDSDGVSVCSDETPDWCIFVLGGTFVGGICETGTCDGACCVKGDCLFVDEINCGNQGGEFLGVGVDCIECGPPTGACCNTGKGGGPFCFEINQSDCEDFGGTYIGDDTLCDFGDCGDVLFGACCYETMLCEELSYNDCVATNGEWYIGEACDFCAPLGACCNFGECLVATQLFCEGELEGYYAGDGTSCLDEPCVTGACCAGSGCFDTNQLECQANEGIWAGPGTACFDFGEIECIFGACCLPDFTCVETLDASCAAAGGEFGGSGSFCDTGGALGGIIVVCVPPVGACCLPDGNCVEVEPSECSIAAGAWQGESTLCSETECESTIILDPPTKTFADGEPVIEEKGDFDGNGFTDIVIAIPDGTVNNGTIQVFLNNGNDGVGGWLGLTELAPITVGVNPSGLAVGLLNGDANLDIAVSNQGDGIDPNTGSVMIFYGNGDGTFILGLTLATGAYPFQYPGGIAAADFTGDGVTDLAVSQRGNDTVVLLENLGGAAPAGLAFNTRQVADTPPDPTVIDPEDVDNDKDIDMVVGTRQGGSVSVLKNEPTLGPGAGNVFEPALNIPVGNDPIDVVVKDIDNDGQPDILTANNDDGTVKIVKNLGGFMFDDSLSPIPVGDQPRSIDTGDFDDDGDEDIAVAADDQFIGPSVQVLENVTPFGGPAFLPPIGFEVDGEPKWLLTEDMNNDGLPDVVTVNEEVDDPMEEGSVTVLLNTVIEDLCPGDVNGDGTVDFDDVVQVLGALGVCGSCVEDINGDGIVDLTDVNTVLLLLGPCPNDQCLADLSGDGTVDFDDLVLLLGEIGPCPVSGPCDADLDLDGQVGLVDLILMLANWGDCPA